MTPLTRFVTRLFSNPQAGRDDSATRAAAMAGAGPSETRTQGGGVAALLTRLRTQHRAASAVASVVAVLGAGAFLTAQAHAAPSFCPQGSGAGQCEGPYGLGVDFQSGHVYVADRGNNRVDVFEADGGFLFAFGWKVDASEPKEELQSCTTASGCLKGSAGAGTGQLSSPQRVAVDNSCAMHSPPLSELTTPTCAEYDPSNGDVYVGTDSFRVQKFDPEGHFLLGFGFGVRDGNAEAETCGPQAEPPSEEGKCLTGIKGKGTCQLQESNATQNPIAIGPGGVVEVGNPTNLKESEGYLPRIERFEANGECIGATPIEGTGEPKRDSPTSLAVNAAGDAYVVFRGGGIHKYHPDGSQYGAPYPLDDDIFATALAVGPEGDLYAPSLGEAGVPLAWKRMITEYGPGGAPLHRFGYGTVSLGSELGVAPYPPAPFPVGCGNVFASMESTVPAGALCLPFPPAGPQVPAESLQVPQATIGNTKATLDAEANAEGKQTHYSFDYVEKRTCEEDEAGGGQCFEAAAHAEGTVPDTEDPEEFRLHKVEAQIGCEEPQTPPQPGCLVPETEYRFRLAAENADGKGDTPIDGGAFTTRPAFEFGSTWALSVGIESAELRAEVNPLGIPSSAHFEYVTQAQYEASGFAAATDVPDVAHGASPIDLGKGEAFLTAEASLSGLSPGTTYRYRLVAGDELIAPEERGGAAGTFTTFAAPGPPEPCPANEAFRAGASRSLPDCRAYEMVSPVDKEGGDILVLRQELTILPAVLEQSATSGAKLAYGSYRAFGGAESAPWTSQYVASRREGEGWTSRGISPPRERAVLPVNPTTDTELKAFSPDLCQAWFRTVAEPDLAPGAAAGFPNFYRRDLCGEGGYEALTTATPPGGVGGWSALELQGVSTDGTRAIYLAPDKLTPEAAPGADQLYEHVGGDPSPHLVCILPNGIPTAPCKAGGAGIAKDGLMRSAAVQGAISASGERVFWSAAAAGTAPVYLRQYPEQGIVAEECSAGKACTVAVSAAGEATSEAPGRARFWCAAAGGSAAIYTVGSDLYEARISEAGGHPVSTTTPIAHEVKGLAGCSAEASHLYLVSEEALTGEAEGEANSEGDFAREGKPNLYLYDSGKPEGERFAFVATVAGADLGDKSYLVSPEVRFRTSRIAPDGEALAFMSAAGPASEAAEGIPAPTGYDNTDASSGEADAEVYLYDARDRRLVCASCDPSGARPEGRLGTTLRDETVAWMAARLPLPQNDLYATRDLADNGKRLFFDSYDALSSRDSNGAEDVYQWEAAGEGGCTQSSPTHSARNGGCVGLISSGTSEQDSEFLDADPGGENAFFTTLAKLVPSDPGLVDVYDARVGGGLPEPPPPTPACEGEACQSPPPAPQDQTPASAAFHGAGNVQEKSAGASRCAKPARKAQSLSKRAKALRRNARKVARHNPRKAKAMRHKAAHLAKAARKQSNSAKRCRARKSKRAGR